MKVQSSRGNELDASGCGAVNGHVLLDSSGE